MLLEKFEGAQASFLGGGGVVAWARIAVEGVAGVVPEDLDCGVCGVDFLDL
jgi:hypothetical protein